ncbi:hypothetical protein JSQ81_09390 [Sporosarcina sp. Marseille-Q4063]|uniref:hypothetical protein n=1 Tax=Sporosarcina sp. Marseille-Q4063 TaxID=2810514 RepID=UPI001BB03D9F|nr:hypothetical protein [Sporosarcina sp. Marseille-Q4063]QUW23687.1 hypothetical protein JSQ81_09390 [Sporosarcina sp. Marseille-Q4063]
MRNLLKLVTIGIIAGIVLAGFMKTIHLLTGNQAYILLFNMDYIPLLKVLPPLTIIVLTFHFLFCIISVVALFHILKTVHLERRVSIYLTVYTGGAAVLFFLTALTEKPPVVTDVFAWLYWTIGHAIYSLTVGYLIKYWQ